MELVDGERPVLAGRAGGHPCVIGKLVVAEVARHRAVCGPQLHLLTIGVAVVLKAPVAQVDAVLVAVPLARARDVRLQECAVEAARHGHLARLAVGRAKKDARSRGRRREHAEVSTVARKPRAHPAPCLELPPIVEGPQVNALPRAHDRPQPRQQAFLNYRLLFD